VECDDVCVREDECERERVRERRERKPAAKEWLTPVAPSHLSSLTHSLSLSRNVLSHKTSLNRSLKLRYSKLVCLTITNILNLVYIFG
jgi:hypothetical protein